MNDTPASLDRGRIALQRREGSALDFIITSRENPAVRQYTLLASSRRERTDRGLFVTEGMKLTAEAAGAGCRLQSLYVTQEAAAKYRQKLEEIGELTLVSPSVAKKLSDTVTSQGVFGVYKKPEPKSLRLSPQGRYLLLSGLQDPGNVGTILRTAAALGITGVILSPDCPDPHGPKVLRASMGGVFRLAMEFRPIGEAVQALEQAGIRVWAAALDSRAIPLQEAGLGSGCAVAIGNEGAGLEKEVIDLCGGTVIIPMAPGNESLNAAMAAGILLWEMTR